MIHCTDFNIINYQNHHDLKNIVRAPHFSSNCHFKSFQVCFFFPSQFSFSNALNTAEGKAFRAKRINYT